MLWMTTILSVFPQIMLVLALYYIVWRSQTMSKDKTGEYDERQMQNRGRAFRAGFLICAISNIFGGVGILVEEWLQPYGAALLVGSAFLGLTVFAVIAIWTDAFLTSARNPRYYLTLAVIIVLGNGFALFAHPDWNTAKELLNSVHLLNLCCMVTFLVVGITLIVKLFLERREA